MYAQTCLATEHVYHYSPFVIIKTTISKCQLNVKKSSTKTTQKTTTTVSTKPKHCSKPATNLTHSKLYNKSTTPSTSRNACTCKHWSSTNKMNADWHVHSCSRHCLIILTHGLMRDAFLSKMRSKKKLLRSLKLPCKLKGISQSWLIILHCVNKDLRDMLRH
jgi:hypothetical protein